MPETDGSYKFIKLRFNANLISLVTEDLEKNYIIKK